MKTSCINHGEHYFFTIRQTYLTITNKNECAAALLSLYEHRHNGLLNNQVESLWQRSSNKFLEQCLLGAFSPKTIRKANELLISLGLIEIAGTESADKGTGENFVFFNVEVVQGLIDKLAKNTPTSKAEPLGKITYPPREISLPPLGKFTDSKIIKNDNTNLSFLEKKKQKKTEKKQPEKIEDSSIKKTTFDPKSNQSEAQLKKEKSCAKKEKRVSPEVPADLEELRAKLTFPLTFTAKMEDALMDFLRYRKERKKPYSNMTSLKTLINTVSTWSEAELVEAVQQSIAAQWTGLFKPKQQPKTKKSAQEILQEASRQNFIECQQGLHSPIDFSEMPF